MLKNLKIKKKLILSFIVVVLLSSISGIVSVIVMNDMNGQYSDALVYYGFAQGDIGKAMLMVAEFRRCTHDIAVDTEVSGIQQTKQELENAKQKYETYKQDVINGLRSEETLAQMEVINQVEALYLAKQEEILDLVGHNTDQTTIIQAFNMCTNELDPLYDQLYDAWASMFNLKVTVGNNTSNALSREAAISSTIAIVLIVVSIVLSVLLGTLIANSISKPLAACVDRLIKLDEGDLTSGVMESDAKDEPGMLLRTAKTTVNTLASIIKDIDRLMDSMAKGNFDADTENENLYVGEFKDLLTAIRGMNYNVSDTLNQINQSADQVSAGSDQVASGSQGLAQGAAEQASSVQELAATINEINNMVNEAAKNADTAAKDASSTAEQIVNCNQQMEALVAAMKEINDSSNEIGKIIGTIENIAFQTNILALNAAVEAARAGSAGKGFAVVADEVRSLANKSQSASQDTATLIERSMEAVSKGMKLANETAAALLSSVDSVKAASQTLDGIRVIAENESSSISQVTQGVDQISSVVQTNSATAEESAAASEELSGQADVLKQLVARFKLRPTDQMPRAAAPFPADSGHAGDAHPIMTGAKY